MSARLNVGFAAVELPSPVGVELCGYGYFLERVCQEELDPLFVRCIALSSGGMRSLVLCADLIGLSDAIHLEVRRLIAEKLGYAGRELMIVCTHTHTGPSTNFLNGGGVMNDDYNSKVAPVFLAAAEAAIKDMAAVESMECCCNPVEDIGYNRNIPNGPHDSVMRGLRLHRAGRRPLAVISYPCHPVVLGPRPQSSADYPGFVCRLADEKGMDAIFLNGCCGDINPIINRIKWGSGTPETALGYAETLMKGYLEGLMPCEDMSLANREFSTVLPLRKVAEADIDEIAGKGYNKAVAEYWRKTMLGDMPGESETITVRALRIGPLTLCSFPFETFTIVGDIVREAYPGRNVAVLGVADHNFSYLPLLSPELADSYAAIDAALLYVHPVIAVGAAESIGRQIAEGIADL